MLSTINDLSLELTCAACAVGIGGYGLWLEWTHLRRIGEMAQGCKAAQEVSAHTEARS